MAYTLKAVHIALTFSNGECRVMAFLTQGRGNVLPRGAVWIEQGKWTREPNDANIFAEISSAHPSKDLEGNARPEVVKYRLMAPDEDTLSDATYRGARVDDGKQLVYDTAKTQLIQETLGLPAELISVVK